MRLASLILRLAAGAILGASLAVPALAQQPAAAPKSAKPAKKLPPLAPPKPVIEPRAVDILKASAAKLASARTMAFNAVVSYEMPSRYGPPLVFTTKSEVTVQRPDSLKVVTVGDGPPSEFYLDGKEMMVFSPLQNLVAVTDAPNTIEGALRKLFQISATYYPFSDVVIADPWAAFSDGMVMAFYVGQSNVVGGVKTDIVAFASDDVWIQAWIGVEDKLPRMLRAVYRKDPSRLRHEMELSNWQIDLALPPGLFGTAQAGTATKIQFARPQEPPGMPPPPKRAAPGAKTVPTKAQ